MISPRSFPFLLRIAALVLAPFAVGISARAAGSGDLSVEYEQVRKIAMRDPHVKDGFDRANERLTQKIVELDPAMKTYALGRAQSPPSPMASPAPASSAGPAAPAVAVRKPAVQTAAAATSAPEHHRSSASSSKTSGAVRTHVVAAGETIAGIAHHYNVSAASIETANHVTDPRKLRAGQSLVIPGAGETATSPIHKPAASVPAASAPASTPVAEPQQDGMWEKLKHSF